MDTKRRRLSGLKTGAAVGALAAASVFVALLYAVQPQSPRDFLDRLVLAANPDIYAPNLRTAERLLERASRAETLSRPVEAESLRWEAASRFGRAGASAPDPRLATRANDGAAGVYLSLGWRLLERGRGILGFRRDPDSLRRAEIVAICVAALAPTGARAEINRFLESVEDELGRPPTGSCPP